MPNTTSNYSLLKPLVGDPIDEDLWGGELNNDMDSLDTLLRSGITIATAASQTTGFTAAVTISVKNLYPCDATGGAFTATLPTAAAAGNGSTVYFKKMDASANAITVTRSSSDTIDGATTKALSIQYDIIALVSDGVSAWRIVSTASSNVFTGDSGSGGTSGLVPAPAAGDAAANKFLKSSGSWETFSPTVYQTTPSNPTGTTSTTGVMMGLAGAITPVSSGKILVIVSGTGQTSSSSGLDGCRVQIRYGTGVAPANAASITGTASGALQTNNPNNNGIEQPFSLNGIVTGLSLGTAIWVDVSLAAINSGTSLLKSISISICEL